MSDSIPPEDIWVSGLKNIHDNKEGQLEQNKRSTSYVKNRKNYLFNRENKSIQSFTGIKTGQVSFR